MVRPTHVWRHSCWFTSFLSPLHPLHTQRRAWSPRCKSHCSSGEATWKDATTLKRPWGCSSPFLTAFISQAMTPQMLICFMQKQKEGSSKKRLWPGWLTKRFSTCRSSFSLGWQSKESRLMLHSKPHLILTSRPIQMWPRPFHRKLFSWRQGYHTNALVSERMISKRESHSRSNSRKPGAFWEQLPGLHHTTQTVQKAILGDIAEQLPEPVGRHIQELCFSPNSGSVFQELRRANNIHMLCESRFPDAPWPLPTRTSPNYFEKVVSGYYNLVWFKKYFESRDFKPTPNLWSTLSRTSSPPSFCEGLSVTDLVAAFLSFSDQHTGIFFVGGGLWFACGWGVPTIETYAVYV